jgi:cell division control protein 6
MADDVDSIFADDVELIQNADILEEDWTPERIVCREDIIDEYTSVFKPIYKGRPPQNAFLYGDTGVGKTAVTRYLFEQLETDIKDKNASVEECEQINLDLIWVNLENNTKTNSEMTSSYQIAVAIINEIRPAEDKIRGTGYAPQDIYDILYDEIEDLGGHVLVVLDEVDRLGDDDTLLYDLSRARDNGYIEQTRVGVIGISNDYTYRKNLSPKVKDTLCETELKFPPYDSTQLTQILEVRAQKALYDEAYGEGILNLCAALAYQEASGSARRAIRLLRKSAEIAENEGTKQIEDHHVRYADDKLKHGNIVESIADQDDEKLYILKALAHLEEADIAPARTRTVHDAYSSVVNQYNNTSGKEPLTQRGMFNHLSKLVMFGFVNTIERNKGNRGGRWDEHTFSEDLDIEQIKEAFEQRGIDWHPLDVTPLEK